MGMELRLLLAISTLIFVRKYCFGIASDNRPLIGFNTTSFTISEDVGQLSLTVISNQTFGQETVLNVIFTGGIPVPAEDSDFMQPSVIAFPASTTSFDITVGIEDNSILSVEDKELIVILLSGVDYVVDTQADVASITIEDDEEATITMTANPSSLMVDEGDSLILTFTSDVISTVNLTVYINHTHVDTTNSDFDYIPEKIVIPPGMTTTTTSYDISADDTFEHEEESFQFILHDDEEYIQLSPFTTQDATIINGDTVDITLADASYSFTEGQQMARATVVIDPSTLTYEITPTVTLEAGSDIDIFNNPAAGTEIPTLSTQLVMTSSMSVVFQIPDDDVLEDDETFDLDLTLVFPGSGDPFLDSVTAIILDDDPVTISINSSTPISVDEGSVQDVIVEVDGDSDIPFSIFLSRPSARASDITIVDNEMDFVSGTSLYTFQIRALTDDILEGTETVNFNTFPSGLDMDQFILTNDEVTVSIGDMTILEVFFIGGATLSEDANRDIMLMANGTASSPLGIDVNITDDTTESGDTFNINTITFQANQDTATATVVVDDGNCELSENFTVSIMSSNPSVITSSLIRAYSIADNDDVSVNFANTSVDVGEGDGNITLELIATCISAIEFDFDVSIDTTDASAIRDTDFSLDNLDPLIVSFTGGSSPNATATIDISEDELFELTETFDVNIINTSRDNVNIGSMDTANVNILDNDEVRVYFNDSTYIVLESDGEIEIGLNIELPPEGSSRNISVMATLTDVSTDGLMDYTQSSFNVHLDIATNETSVSTSFIVMLENDDIPEAAEEFTITLTFEDPIVVFNGSVPVVIQDDDGIPHVLQEDVTSCTLVDDNMVQLAVFIDHVDDPVNVTDEYIVIVDTTPVMAQSIFTNGNGTYNTTFSGPGIMRGSYEVTVVSSNTFRNGNNISFTAELSFSDLTGRSPSNLSCFNTCPGESTFSSCKFTVADFLVVNVPVNTDRTELLLVCATHSVYVEALTDDGSIAGTDNYTLTVQPSTAVVSADRLSACSNRATDGTFTVTAFILHIEEPFIDCISSYDIAVNTTSEVLSTSGNETLNTTFPSLVAEDYEVVVVPTNILGAGESTNFTIGVRAFSDVTVSSPSNFSCTNTCTGFVSHQYCAFSVGDVTADISTGTQVQRDLLVCKTLNVSAYALRDDRTVIATELSQIYVPPVITNVMIDDVMVCSTGWNEPKVTAFIMHNHNPYRECIANYSIYVTHSNGQLSDVALTPDVSRLIRVEFLTGGNGYYNLSVIPYSDTENGMGDAVSLSARFGAFSNVTLASVFPVFTLSCENTCAGSLTVSTCRFVFNCMDEVNDSYSVSEEVVVNTPMDYPLVNCTLFNVSVDAAVSSGVNLTENYILEVNCPCENGGTCVLVDGNVECSCTEDFTGMFCQTERFKISENVGSIVGGVVGGAVGIGLVAAILIAALLLALCWA